jgi:hypothetical protein
MKNFLSYLKEESEKPTRLGHLVKVGTKMEDADFWIHRRHSIDKVGHPTKEYNPEHFGVKVIHPDLDSQYAYYMMQHLAHSGYYRGLATGTTDLVSIRKEHITNIPLR